MSGLGIRCRDLGLGQFHVQVQNQVQNQLRGHSLGHCSCHGSGHFKGHFHGHSHGTSRVIVWIRFRIRAEIMEQDHESFIMVIVMVDEPNPNPGVFFLRLNKTVSGGNFSDFL